MKPTDVASALTHETLLSLLSYEPLTGVFRWRVKRPNGVKSGDEAGAIQKSSGYRLIKLGGRNYHASRLAWFYTTGAWPADRVDHENLLRSDNRWANLRAATFAENIRNRRAHRNSASGLKGVHFKADGNRQKRWAAHIRIAGVLKTLGYFLTPEEAHAAYDKAAHEVFGSFARI